MVVSNDTLFIYGGYCKVVTKGPKIKGEKAVGVVHTDLWSLRLSADFKNLRWERRKRSGFAPTSEPELHIIPSFAKPRFIRFRPRSGAAMTLYKNRAILFGGVHDEDVSDEELKSTFYNDLYACSPICYLAY